MGLEPTRSYEHQHLKLACLPIPAYPYGVDFYLCTDGKSTKTTQRFIKLALPPTTYWVSSPNTQLTHGRGKFYFAFLYLDRRFPQATYPVSRGGLVRNKPRYLDRSVVVETYKTRVNASMVPNKGLEPLRHKTSEPKSDVSANSTNSANSARHTSIQAYLDNRITLTVVQATRASILH